MESSIAVFLKRWLACEQPPTEAVHDTAHTPAQLRCRPCVGGHSSPSLHLPHLRGAYRLRRALPTSCDCKCRQYHGPVAACEANLPG